MTFTDGYRVERVYFERLKSLITILKSLKDGVEDETVRTLIENAIDSDGAILLLYRNLGEAWAELADQVQKTRKMLQDLDEKTENYHDELNERIDEVNNYLMALIRALEARMDAVEADLAQMGRLFTYDLQRVNDEYTLTESGQPVTWTGTKEKVEHVRPHFVTVRGSLDGEVTYLMPREYDTAQASGIFEWYSVGFVGNEIHEVTVTLLPDDSVNVAIHTTDFAAILQRISNLETRMTTAESDIDNLETRMQTAESDIDTLEQTAENHNERITDLETCCDDMQENVIPQIQTTLAGKQDALTAGSGILLNNNIVSNNFGCGSMGNLTREADGSLATGNFSVFNSNNPLCFIFSKPFSLRNYKGIYFNNSVRGATNYNTAWKDLLSNFESDCELKVSVIVFISNYEYNKDVTPASAIYYFRDAISLNLLCNNGVVKLDSNILNTNNTRDPITVLATGMSPNRTEYIRVNNPELYCNSIIVINPITTTKTSTEWLDFINNSLSTVSGLYQLQVFGTEN